jgi:hypothetical protein
VALWCDSLTHNRQALLAAVDQFGPEYVVIDSDYPYPAMPEPIDDIVADLPAEFRHRISKAMWRNTTAHFLGLGLTHYPLLAGIEEHIASMLRWNPDRSRHPACAERSRELAGGDARRVG